MVLFSALIVAKFALQTAAFQLSVPNLPKAPAAETVLAKVNGAEIKAKDIQDLLWEVRGEEILNDVIFYQLAKQEGDRLGIVVTDAEIEAGVKNEMDIMSKNLAEGQTLEQAMAAAGQTKSRLYLGMKTSLLLTKISMAQFDAKAYIKVSTILVRPRSNAASDVSNTIQVVQKAYDRINAGEPWEKLVDELVTDAEGKRSRGLLGWRQLAAFPETTRPELTALARGKVTKPVQTQNGIQIFRIEARGLDATKDELESLKTELADTFRLQAVQKLRQTMKIERFFPTKPGG
ncbi:MAG TPA: peptidylprolyl isomerase [Fimbriimonas sp.]|nr:peptidylprolyl isomerase [Fimbriimonas sp.]